MTRGNENRERLLVTGGAGFIGANFVRAALAAGYEVTVLDNFSQGTEAYVEGLPMRLVRGDILDRDLVAQEVADHSMVVHLAAQTGVPSSLDDPRRDCEINVIGTLNILEACRVSNGESRRFVFASSNAPLGRQKPPATEDKAPLPVSPYGASKLAGEAYCLAYQGSWGIETVALRFGNVYGPFSAHKGSVVAKFIKDLNAAGRVTIDGSGEQTRDFIYAEDLCDALLLALKRPASGEIFQIATGIETSIAELARHLSSVAKRDLQVAHAPARIGDVQRNYSLIAKARQILGWEPKTSLAEGLVRTYRWFMARS